MPLEDFTTYTEVDSNNKLTVTSSRVTATNVIRNESCYVYKDKGAGFFTDFVHKIVVQCSDADESASGAWLTCWAVSVNYGDFVGFGGSGGANCLSVFFNYSTADGANKIRLYLRETVYGTGAFDAYCVLDQATTYYLTIERSGTSLTCKIYSDSARTNLITTLSLTLHSTPIYRYILVSTSVTATGTVWISGFVENLDLGLGAISGITRDANGNPLGSCTVWLFKTGDKSFIEETTSDVNGNYSFSNKPTSVQYFIRSHKDGTPNVFGTTDRNLVAT